MILSNYFNIPSLSFSVVCNIIGTIESGEKIYHGKRDTKLSSNLINSFLSLF